jgi:hypothetical protein
MDVQQKHRAVVRMKAVWDGMTDGTRNLSLRLTVSKMMATTTTGITAKTTTAIIRMIEI